MPEPAKTSLYRQMKLETPSVSEKIEPGCSSHGLSTDPVSGYPGFFPCQQIAAAGASAVGGENARRLRRTVQARTE